MFQVAPYRFFVPPLGISKYGIPAIDAQVKVNGLLLNPSQKPVELMRWLVRHFSKVGDRVLSLFDGTGTTTVAALMEGRHCVGLDYCTEMHQQASFRVQTFLKTEKVLAESLAPPASDAPRPTVTHKEVQAKIYELLEEGQDNPEEEGNAVMAKATPYISEEDRVVFEDYVKIAMSRQLRVAIPSYDQQRLMRLCSGLSRIKMIWNINKVLREKGQPPKQHPLRVQIGEGDSAKVLNAQYPPASEKYPEGPEDQVLRYSNFLLFGDDEEEFKVEEAAVEVVI